MPAALVSRPPLPGPPPAQICKKRYGALAMRNRPLSLHQIMFDLLSLRHRLHLFQRCFFDLAADAVVAVQSSSTATLAIAAADRIP